MTWSETVQTGAVVACFIAAAIGIVVILMRRAARREEEYEIRELEDTIWH